VSEKLSNLWRGALVRLASHGLTGVNELAFYQKDCENRAAIDQMFIKGYDRYFVFDHELRTIRISADGLRAIKGIT